MNTTIISAGKHKEISSQQIGDFLLSREERKFDMIVNMSQTIMQDDGYTIGIHARNGAIMPLVMNRTALDQTLDLYESKSGNKLPLTTFENVLSPTERQTVWNREIRGLGVERKFRTHRQRNAAGEIVKDSTLAAYANVSTRYKPIDNAIVNRIVAMSDVPLVSVTGTVIDTDHSKFRFIPENSGAISVGEFTPGVEITNSESGNGALEIFAFVYRKVCTNGMMVKVTDASMRMIHLGNSHLKIPNFSNVWSEALDLCKLHNSATTKILTDGDRNKVLDFAKNKGLTVEQTTMITETANRFYDGGRTAADMVGAITHSAQRYNNENTKNRTVIELFAGDTLKMLMEVGAAA